MKPKILISAPQKMQNYIDAIESAGGVAYAEYLPSVSTDYDGLLLCGGNDIHPSYYGQEINGAHSFDTERDKAEFNLIRAFMDTGKPILGICRGHQLLNVALGGTLIQDLKNTSSHLSQGDEDLIHSVDATGFMAELFGKTLVVNSSHHQAIDTLGNGLTPVAYCGDVIEAVQHNTLPYISVQFHPERMKEGDTACGEKIFEYFIALTKKHK